MKWAKNELQNMFFQFFRQKNPYKNDNSFSVKKLKNIAVCQSGKFIIYKFAVKQNSRSFYMTIIARILIINNQNIDGLKGQKHPAQGIALGREMQLYFALKGQKHTCNNLLLPFRGAALVLRLFRALPWAGCF